MPSEKNQYTNYLQVVTRPARHCRAL